MVFNFLGCAGMQCLIRDSANSHSNVIMCRLFLKYNSNALTYYVFSWTRIFNFKSIELFHFKCNENNDAKVKTLKKVSYKLQVWTQNKQFNKCLREIDEMEKTAYYFFSGGNLHVCLHSQIAYIHIASMEAIWLEAMWLEAVGWVFHSVNLHSDISNCHHYLMIYININYVYSSCEFKCKILLHSVC